MPIPMQGSWTVSVKSKEAAFPQRFVIAGAATGNGVYSGVTTTPAVHVTGERWSIAVEHDPGTGAGWIESVEQIKFPTISGGQYHFDIESNDTGGDQDFNDLILTCSTPFTGVDYLIYGTVSYYSDTCLFNPCSPKPYLVIDSAVALEAALLRPALRKPLELLYPHTTVIRRPPLPDPPPFHPLVLPAGQEVSLPAKQAQIFATQEVPGVERTATSALAARKVTSIKTVQTSKPAVAAAPKYEVASLLGLHESLLTLCDTGPLPGYALHFQEYDRTAAELAGGAYTGAGHRDDLGGTVTDRNGNYIFRFTATLGEILEEFGDIAPGEGVVQLLPDVIVQVLDPSLPTQVIYESAPYWNVPITRKINVCVPASKVTPLVCDTQLIIQKIGNIYIGPLNTTTMTRTGPNTFLTADGKITNANPYYGPGVRCAAWLGTLQLYACLKNPAIQYYTIRYKKPTDSTWKFIDDSYVYYKYDATSLNPFVPVVVGYHPINLDIDGGGLVEAKAYHNIEVDSGAAWLPPNVAKLPWLECDKVRKALLTTTIYQTKCGGPGPVQFRIEGYDALGARFPGADDIITLYLDNTAPDVWIDKTIKMINPDDPTNPQAFDDCALFTLPTGHPDAPLRLQFRANQKQGFANVYELYMYKGSTGVFSLAQPAGAPPPYRTRAYTHSADCSTLFYGTTDDPNYDFAISYVTVDVIPAASEGGTWLKSTQTFCAFSIHLYCSVRQTDGYTVPGPYWAPVPIVIGIQKK